jgi:hypothetical protein
VRNEYSSTIGEGTVRVASLQLRAGMSPVIHDMPMDNVLRYGTVRVDDIIIDKRCEEHKKQQYFEISCNLSILQLASIQFWIIIKPNNLL